MSVGHRSKGSSPYNNIGIHLLFNSCNTTSSDANQPILSRLLTVCFDVSYSPDDTDAYASRDEIFEEIELV